jgi:thiamine pyrophosphate-dependent acetolactate synthase large subunit-like protein
MVLMWDNTKCLPAGMPNSILLKVMLPGGLGTMGFALPAAMVLKWVCQQEVVAVGDGGFQMTIQELGTIFQTESTS